LTEVATRAHFRAPPAVPIGATAMELPTPESDAEQQGLLKLSEALDELALHDPRLAEVVDIKYFCGFSLTDIAAMRGVALRTVQRDWDKARLFLFRELNEPAGS